MTISAVNPLVTFVGSSGAGTLGPFSLVKSGTPITFSDNSYIKVYRYSSVTDASPDLLTENTDYTLTGGPDAGSITLTSPQTGLLDTERLRVFREQPKRQPSSFGNGGDFNSATVETTLDTMTEQLQEVDSRGQTALRFDNLESDTVPSFGSFESAIGKIAYFDGTVSSPVVAHISASGIGILANDLASGDSKIDLVAANIIAIQSASADADRAEAAEVAAEAYSAAASDSQTGAETAEAGAETARDQVLNAVTLSENIIHTGSMVLQDGSRVDLGIRDSNDRLSFYVTTGGLVYQSNDSGTTTEKIWTQSEITEEIEGRVKIDVSDRVSEDGTRWKMAITFDDRVYFGMAEVSAGVFEFRSASDAGLQKITTEPASSGVPVSGQYKTATVPGPISNRSRDQVSRLDAITGAISGEVAHQWRQLTAGPYDANYIQEVASGQIQVRRNGRTDDVFFRTSGLLGGADKVYGFIVLSQSLGLGHKDGGAVSMLFNEDPVAPLKGNYGGAGMFDSSAVDGFDRGPRVLQVEPISGSKNVALDTGQIAKVVSLRESMHAGSTTYHETIQSSLAHSFLNLHCERQTVSLHANIGTGSTAISHFEKGSVTGAHYANLLLVAQEMEDYATALGRDCEIYVIWNQGEQDNTDATPEATYKTAISGIATDLDTDIRAITGQSVFELFVQQTSQITSGALGMSGDAQADLMIDGTVKGLATYPMLPGSSGSTHMMPATYMPWGAATAYEIAACIDAPTRKPVHCTFASKAGATATFTLTGGSGAGYQTDTDTIPNAPDNWFGFTASDAGGDMTVSSFTISGTTLTVVFDATISGTLNWKFGIDHYTGGGSIMPNSDAPRVNIRDGSNYTCPMTGQVVSGWMIQHQGSN